MFLHRTGQNQDAEKYKHNITYLLLGNQHSKSINQVMIAIELQIFLPLKDLIQQRVMNTGKV